MVRDMDYSKLPIGKRTRLQNAVFYREYNEKKKKNAEQGGDGGSGGGGGGNRGRESGGRARVEGGVMGANLGSRGLGDSGSVARGQVEANGVNVGVKEGVGPVSFEKGKTSGTKKIRKSKKGSKKNKSVVPINGDSKKIRKNRKVMKKDKNVVKPSVDSENNPKYSERMTKNRNVVRMGFDDVGRGDEVRNPVKASVHSKKNQKSRKGLKKNNNVLRMGSDDDERDDKVRNLVKASVHSKKNQNSSKGLKKNKNVFRMGSDDDERDDEVRNLVKASVHSKKDQKSSKGLKKNKNAVRMGSDDDERKDEVQFLCTKDEYGRVLEVNEVAEDGIVDSSCSSLEKESGSKEVCKFKNFRHMDGEKIVSSSRKRDKGAGFKINDGKRCGVSSQARSWLGVSKKRKEVSDNDDESEDEIQFLGMKDKYGCESDSTDSTECIDSSESGDSESSREEASDRFSDQEYEVDNSSSSINSFDSSSSSEDEDESSVGNRVSVHGKGKNGSGSVKGGLKRRVENLVDGKENVKEEIEGPESVGERLCLRRASKSTKSKKKKQELGTFSRPFTFTDEELDSSSGDEDPFDNVVKTCFKNGSDGKFVQKAGEKGKGKVGRPAKRRRNGMNPAAPMSVDKILADSIWEKGDVPLENLVSSGDKVPVQQATLPIKFRFEDEYLKPPEKSYWEMEADKLFAERDFALAASEIDSSVSSVVETEDGITQETENDPATCCRQGKHQLVLDEQIGLKCKFCSFVELEIKYILPSFSKHPWGRPDKKNLGCTDHFNLDELQFQDSASLSQFGSRRYVHAEGTVWDIIPGIKHSMYLHQREGFEFIWKNIAGGIDLEELKKQAFDGGSGCIISHAPGTGKTRLTIMFLQTYMELYRMCRPVIIAPCSMLLTWEEEFRKWKVDIPFHNLNKLEFSGQENAAAVNLLRQVGRQGQNKNSIRMVKLYSWKNDRSILGISYTLFEKLAGDGVLADGGKRKKNVKGYAEGKQVRKMLLQLPGLLVLDEGHTPRNDQSLIWKALSGVETQRRIILSGTPFQNNFGELFNTLCVVRPKFADRVVSETWGDSGRKRGRKSSAARGKWASLTSSIGKNDDDKLDELRAMIDPFVHVHKGTILKESLPGLRDSMVVLHPTHLQKALIKVIQGRKNPLELDYLTSLISVHPSLLLGCFLSEKEELSVDTKKLEKLRLDPEAGVKTKFLRELIRLSEALKEKVLVFSQFIDPLTFIREQLKSHFGWTEGKEVLYMDGALDAKQRQSSISLLNDPKSEVRVLLASMKACSEGINLIGASRVVLLDVVWNPSVERQAISRAYRLGQKKVVYVYHLVTSGTMEGEKYVRQAEKDRLSELVFSSADGGLHEPEISCTVAEDKILQEMVQHEKISSMLEKILNQPKESNLIDTFG